MNIVLSMGDPNENIGVIKVWGIIILCLCAMWNPRMAVWNPVTSCLIRELYISLLV